MNDILLQTENLTVGYGKHIVVQGMELCIHSGEIVTLIGANGAGKSTVLKTIALKLAPLAGTVYFHDKAHIPERELAKILSVVLTARIDPELMTCEDVVSSGRYPYTGRLGILSAHDRQKVAEVMEMTSVMELRDRPFSQISDGQRQRVMLARAICQEPEILLLDEPTSFLDMKHKLELLMLIRRLAREHQTGILLSLHELDLAERISDRLLCIRNGKIDRTGTPDEIFKEDYIQELYQISCGSYHPITGAELETVRNKPKIFVIGGGGAGISVYRHLQRKGIPFACGVLHENDIEYPSASALASEVISEKAFEPVSEIQFQKAVSVLRNCKHVICACRYFGTMNEKNRHLLKIAEASGRLIPEYSA